MTTINMAWPTGALAGGLCTVTTDKARGDDFPANLDTVMCEYDGRITDVPFRTTYHRVTRVRCRTLGAKALESLDSESLDIKADVIEDSVFGSYGARNLQAVTLSGLNGDLASVSGASFLSKAHVLDASRVARIGERLELPVQLHGAHVLDASRVARIGERLELPVRLHGAHVLDASRVAHVGERRELPVRLHGAHVLDASRVARIGERRELPVQLHGAHVLGRAGRLRQQKPEHHVAARQGQ